MAIIKEKGRYKSIRSKDTIEVELNTEEEKLLEKIIKGDKKLLKAIYSEYDEVPVSAREFFSSEYYIGPVVKTLRPKLKDDLIEIFSGNYHEIIFGGAVRYGKTTVATLIMMRVLYELMCLRNPAEYFKLNPTDNIVLVNFSITEDLALETLFEGLVSKIKSAGYFQKVGYKERSEYLMFPKNVIVKGGESTDSGMLGLNIICGVMDEANFYTKEGTYKRVGIYRDKAEALYKGLSRRIGTTFLVNGKRLGKCVLLSSKRDPDDFVERRVKEVEGQEGVFVREYSLYEIAEEQYKDMERFMVFIGKDGEAPRIISKYEVKSVDEDYIEYVPEVFYDEYDNDIIGALRDISGIGISGVQLFFSKRDKIREAFATNREVVFDRVFIAGKDELNVDQLVERKVENNALISIPKMYPDKIRYVSIDFGIKHDRTGFAMGCICDYVESMYKNDKEQYVVRLPKIYLDLTLAIKAEGGELEFAYVRNLIYYLITMGYKIRFVACDSFQSYDTLQQLRLHGIESEVISVDRTMMPYEILKNCIYDGRLIGYKYDILIEELEGLIVTNNKVDHKRGGSKDVADAVASLVYALTEEKYKGLHERWVGQVVAGEKVPEEPKVVYEFEGEREEVAREIGSKIILD